MKQFRGQCKGGTTTIYTPSDSNSTSNKPIIQSVYDQNQPPESTVRECPQVRTVLALSIIMKLLATLVAEKVILTHSLGVKHWSSLWFSFLRGYEEVGSWNFGEYG